MYAKLGCLHSLQPAPSSDGFEPPRTPALKPRGFTKWQSIQLLLMPGEHVPYVQNALRRFDIVDPRTGAAFPKLLPKEAFPSEPDEGLVRWYEDVSNKLRDTGSTSGSEPGGRFRDADVGYVHGDNGYFSNPGFHDRRGSAALGRGAARPGPRTPVEFLQDRGRAVVSPRCASSGTHDCKRLSRTMCGGEAGTIRPTSTTTTTTTTGSPRGAARRRGAGETRGPRTARRTRHITMRARTTAIPDGSAASGPARRA